jgi:diguanylate cyclase
VINDALAFAASLDDEHRSLTVSVNISPQDLLDDTLPEVVARALAKHRFNGNRLTLEITEDALVREPDRARRLLAPLRSRGVRVAVDDFGTGYQSLGQLIALDIDEVKLDRSLVADVADNLKSQAVVRAMATLTQSLGLDLVSEGIETHEALERLRDLGCTTAQGYLFSRPVPGPDLAAVIDAINHDRFAAVVTSEYRDSKGIDSRVPSAG